MADHLAQSKRRKLRQASVTMRERAEKEAKRSGKMSLRRALKHTKEAIVRLPIWAPFSKLKRLPIWKPFKLIGLLLAPPYIRNSWRELRLVTWPNGKQTRQLTAAVVIFSIVFGAIVAAFDYGLDKLFKQVIIK